MRFFRFRLFVRDTFNPKDTYHPQSVIGADSQETALAQCKKAWENAGYDMLEVISCEEIYPKLVFCNQVVE